MALKTVGQLSAATAISATSDLLLIEQGGYARQDDVYTIVEAAVVISSTISTINSDIDNLQTAVTAINAELDLLNYAVRVDSSTTVSTQRYIYVSAAAATITLPSGAAIGRTVSVRKINSDETTTVTIIRSGSDTFTKAALTTLSIYANGGFWTLEKTTSNRWDITEGYDGVSTSTGIWTRYPDGMQEALYIHSASIAIDVTTSSVFRSAELGGYTWPVPFQAIKDCKVSHAGPNSALVYQSMPTSTLTTCFLYLVRFATESATTRTVTFSGIGRWYSY